MLKKRNLLFLSLLILGILLLSSCFLNPPATEGILKGQVLVPEGTLLTKDLTGQALPDATVNIIDLSTDAIIATTTTDANGYYQVSVPPGGPYLLEAVKDGVKLEQITCSVEVGIEYDLGTADCVTTAAALIAQAMMDAGDNPADIDCAAIIADPNFDDVSSIVCSTIQAGQDPTVSAAVLQAVEDFLHPPEPAPTPTPTPTPAVINIEAIAGVTIPVKCETPVTMITATAQYTGAVTWSGTPVAFAGATVYTAIITLTPKPGFTLTGVAANFFTVAGAVATNPIDSGVVTAVFPETDPLVVGDSYGGGIVAYILQSGDPGYDENKQHGLIAAAADQSTGIQWYNGDYEETGATDTAIGTGLANTNKIIDVQGETATDYAAGLSRAYDGGGYDDWFLPSKEELNKLYLNKVAIGGFAVDYYWSSSEFFAYDDAWFQLFYDGGQDLFNKLNSFRVRAVRAF